MFKEPDPEGWPTSCVLFRAKGEAAEFHLDDEREDRQPVGASYLQPATRDGRTRVWEHRYESRIESILAPWKEESERAVADVLHASQYVEDPPLRAYDDVDDYAEEQVAFQRIQERKSQKKARPGKLSPKTS